MCEFSTPAISVGVRRVVMAGFCCTGGSGSDSAGLIKLFGLEQAREYAQGSARAVHFVRELGEEEGIDSRPQATPN